MTKPLAIFRLFILVTVMFVVFAIAVTYTGSPLLSCGLSYLAYCLTVIWMLARDHKDGN